MLNLLFWSFASAVGINKKIDNAVRIVIPKELRERFILFGEVKVIATPKGVLIRNPLYEIIKKKEEQ